MPFTRKFYVADSHFGHLNILSSCRRPFTSVEEMDEAMIARWNVVVGENDIVFHLGDFAVGVTTNRVAEIFGRLSGRKRLVLGNHDLDRKGNVHKSLADLAWDEPPAHALETKDGGRRVYLSHYAHRTWPASGYGSIHFFGHSHGNLPSLGRSRDVGVDLPDVRFTPRTFDELTAGMEL